MLNALHGRLIDIFDTLSRFILTGLVVEVELFLLPLPNALDDEVTDVCVKLIWSVNILIIAEAHVWHIDEHHNNFILANVLRLTKVKHLENIEIQNFVFRSAKVPKAGEKVLEVDKVLIKIVEAFDKLVNSVTPQARNWAVFNKDVPIHTKALL